LVPMSTTPFAQHLPSDMITDEIARKLEQPGLARQGSLLEVLAAAEWPIAEEQLLLEAFAKAHDKTAVDALGEDFFGLARFFDSLPGKVSVAECVVSPAKPPLRFGESSELTRLGDDRDAWLRVLGEKERADDREPFRLADHIREYGGRAFAVHFRGDQGDAVQVRRWLENLIDGLGAQARCLSFVLDAFAPQSAFADGVLEMFATWPRRPRFLLSSVTDEASLRQALDWGYAGACFAPQTPFRELLAARHHVIKRWRTEHLGRFFLVCDLRGLTPELVHARFPWLAAVGYDAVIL